MGQGVGLEVGNSIHFRAKPNRFSYWDTDNTGREMVQTLIHSGHIDCLHSFGERIFTRDEAKEALNELIKHDCRLEVWVDHGSAITNFGADIMAGHGDEVGHPAYHADLTIPYGIKYICRGRGTSIVGQDTKPKLGSIFNERHPAASSRTLLKEAAKRTLAKFGNTKYAMHLKNEILRPIVLRDGSAAYEFIRCNPHWRGVSYGDQGRYIADVLTHDFFEHLINSEGVCILYTHLGKVDNPKIPFDKKAVNAFGLLSEKFHNSEILVTTTRRLLGYCRAVREIKYSTSVAGDMLSINIDTKSSKSPAGELSEADLNGLTFYVNEPLKTRLTINEKQIAALKHNEPDKTGRSSVSIVWPLLKFPQI
jgi:hypothetical protein